MSITLEEIVRHQRSTDDKEGVYYVATVEYVHAMKRYPELRAH